jgi:hypothetical protein
VVVAPEGIQELVVLVDLNVLQDPLALVAVAVAVAVQIIVFVMVAELVAVLDYMVKDAMVLEVHNKLAAAVDLVAAVAKIILPILEVLVVPTVVELEDQAEQHLVFQVQ